MILCIGSKDLNKELLKEKRDTRLLFDACFGEVLGTSMFFAYNKLAVASAPLAAMLGVEALPTIGFLGLVVILVTFAAAPYVASEIKPYLIADDLYLQSKFVY